MARLLMAVIVPAHMFYFFIIYGLKYVFDFSVEITAPFLLCYCLAILVQLFVLLYLAQVSVFAAWRVRINPDNSAIPFTSALCDVLGNCFMALVFFFLASIGDKNALPEVIVSTTTMLPNSTLITMGNATLSTLLVNASG